LSNLTNKEALLGEKKRLDLAKNRKDFGVSGHPLGQGQKAGMKGGNDPAKGFVNPGYCGMGHYAGLTIVNEWFSGNLERLCKVGAST